MQAVVGVGREDNGEALLLAIKRSPDSLPTHVASSIKHHTVCSDHCCMLQYAALQ